MLNQILKTSQKENSEREQYTLLLTPESNKISQRRKQTKTSKSNSSWFYLGLVGNIGYTVALPIVAGALLGSFIDNKLSWYPKATLSGILVGTILSVLGFIQTIRDIIRQKH
jgi:predicted F0F1-ATPase subunit